MRTAPAVCCAAVNMAFASRSIRSEPDLLESESNSATSSASDSSLEHFKFGKEISVYVEQRSNDLSYFSEIVDRFGTETKMRVLYLLL